jgi:phenylalanyl-tRNA synthetase beta chain
MKVSEKWLREFVDPTISIEEIGELMTFAGVELEAIEPVASAFTHVVVGGIITLEQHPDADRLTVCQVNVAADEPIQIVTNVGGLTEGMKVPVAMIGANLPAEDGSAFKIKKTKLRGVLSQGMFCGAETLGIDDSSEGLLTIPEHVQVGADVRSALALDDVVLDFDVTPNRADCLSMVGMAREVGVLTETTMTAIEHQSTPHSHDDVFGVTLKAEDACPRYAGCVIKNVDVQAKTPDWMVEKLHRAGISSLSAVVDVTNYVLLELGQPMHAFDLARLDSAITVRFAEEGEKLTLLDEQAITLKADSVVIADAKGAIALAGIMGGLVTAVTNDTTDIFLESAHFTPESIAGKARSYGLHTDSSFRFERGVSPDLQVVALDRAIALIIAICGGEVGPVIDINTKASLQHKPSIPLRASRITRVLGIEIEKTRVEAILQRLGCDVSATDEGWDVIAPLFRFDISLEVDLIEELARINGYDKIPSRLRKLKPLVTTPKETEIQLDIFHKVLTSRDYQEVVSYSFVDAETEQLLTPDSDAVKLANPLSVELAVMRTTLWSGLLKVLKYNLKRQQSRVRLFETGLSFIQTDNGLKQRKKIAGVITGSVSNQQWSLKSRTVDFYDIKGDVEALLTEVKGKNFVFKPDEKVALHSGQAASIFTQGIDEAIGWVGALHPSIEKKMGFNQAVYMFEIDLAHISARVVPEYAKVSPYPVIQRDLALLVDDVVSYNVIRTVLDTEKIEQLVDYSVFDHYVGEGIATGKKSLALSLTFQDASRTLEETDINNRIETLISLLQEKTGAELRV